MIAIRGTSTLTYLPTNYYITRIENKSGKANEIPLFNILAVDSVDDHTSDVISGKEWAYQFRVVTKERPYEFRAFSWSDRDIWMKGFKRLLDYKKKILARRSTSIDNLKIDIHSRPQDPIYHLRVSDFGMDGRVLPLEQIPIEEMKQPEYFDEEDQDYMNEGEENKSENAQIDSRSFNEFDRDKEVKDSNKLRKMLNEVRFDDEQYQKHPDIDSNVRNQQKILRTEGTNESLEEDSPKVKSMLSVLFYLSQRLVLS